MNAAQTWNLSKIYTFFFLEVSVDWGKFRLQITKSIITILIYGVLNS